MDRTVKEHIGVKWYHDMLIKFNTFVTCFGKHELKLKYILIYLFAKIKFGQTIYNKTADNYYKSSYSLNRGTD